jgi:copper chaperone NosL
MKANSLRYSLTQCRRLTIASALVLALSSVFGCKKGGSDHNKAQVTAAQKGLDKNGAMQISEADRCPVCGMRIAKHKKFASAIELSSGEAYYFCGTGCLIKSWLHPEIFIGKPKSALERAVTPEYFGGKYIDALSARWVAGSDVVGPMGPALVPLKNDADLATFKKRHGGKTVFRLGELTDATFKAITGKDVTKRPPKKKKK